MVERWTFLAAGGPKPSELPWGLEVLREDLGPEAEQLDPGNEDDRLAPHGPGAVGVLVISEVVDGRPKILLGSEDDVLNVW
eukprot:15098332-Alexandrium_andersonii.AAC.1